MVAEIDWTPVIIMIVTVILFLLYWTGIFPRRVKELGVYEPTLFEQTGIEGSDFGYSKIMKVDTVTGNTILTLANGITIENAEPLITCFPKNLKGCMGNDPLARDWMYVSMDDPHREMFIREWAERQGMHNYKAFMDLKLQKIADQIKEKNTRERASEVILQDAKRVKKIQDEHPTEIVIQGMGRSKGGFNYGKSDDTENNP